MGILIPFPWFYVMAKVIAVIELSKGSSYFYDEINDIYLSNINKTSNIYSNYDLTAIKRGIKNKEIHVKSGSLKSGFNSYPKLMGVENRTIQIHQYFDKMKGVSAMADEIKTQNIKVRGLVNTDVPGNYTLIYSVSDKAGNKASVERVITVVDNIGPVFTGCDFKAISKGEAFDPFEGVTATDNVDGVIPKEKITLLIKNSEETVIDAVDINTVGNYYLSYSATDNAGNIGKAERTIQVKEPLDTEAPKFSGVDNKTVNVGDDFDAMDGVTAVDNVDGDVTGNVDVKLKDNEEQTK